MKRAHGLLLLLAVLALDAGAQIHMCKDANGRKVFSDEPCGPDAAVVNAKPALGGPTISPSTQLQTQYYEIRGTRWEELVQEIRAKGPEGWWGNAQTGLTYAIQVRESADGCTVETVLVNAESRVRLPSWANRYEGSPALQTLWDGALGTLDLHERGHVAISIEGAREIERALNEIPKQATCVAVRDEARRRFDRLRAVVSGRQSAYDRATNHGLQQWTPYKDSPR